MPPARGVETTEGFQSFGSNVRRLFRHYIRDDTRSIDVKCREFESWRWLLDAQVRHREQYPGILTIRWSILLGCQQRPWTTFRSSVVWKTWTMEIQLWHCRTHLRFSRWSYGKCILAIDPDIANNVCIKFNDKIMGFVVNATHMGFGHKIWSCFIWGGKQKNHIVWNVTLRVQFKFEKSSINNQNLHQQWGAFHSLPVFYLLCFSSEKYTDLNLRNASGEMGSCQYLN